MAMVSTALSASNNDAFLRSRVAASVSTRPRRLLLLCRNSRITVVTSLPGSAPNDCRKPALSFSISALCFAFSFFTIIACSFSSLLSISYASSRSVFMVVRCVVKCLMVCLSSSTCCFNLRSWSLIALDSPRNLLFAPCKSATCFLYSSFCVNSDCANSSVFLRLVRSNFSWFCRFFTLVSIICTTICDASGPSSNEPRPVLLIARRSRRFDDRNDWLSLSTDTSSSARSREYVPLSRALRFLSVNADEPL
mmetsp:Transcript_47423/g.76073  ORF Transcript_47423/g.76073 Transcript_47423/m.76073 type:complete len:251 (-) Transcript_47423:879-1631(-)